MSDHMPDHGTVRGAIALATIRDGILDGMAVPQLVLRTGWAPACATPVPPSRRRQLDEVVANLAGTGTR